MKKFLFFILSITFLLALSEDLMVIESKLYSKIIKLHTQKENVKIGIVCDKFPCENAKKLEKFLKRNQISAFIVSKDNLKNADAYILTAKNPSKECIDALLKKQKLIFALYPENIKYAMISIYVGPKIKLLINPKIIKKANIRINPIFFKVGKIYEE